LALILALRLSNSVKNDKAPQRKPLRRFDLRGAGDRARTGDIQLGRLTLYQLSYSRETTPTGGAESGNIMKTRHVRNLAPAGFSLL
jgi:hypothetical protein